MEASRSPIFKNNGHLKRELLGLHVLEDLAIFTRIRVEEHLVSCGPCRDRLEAMREIVAALRGAPPLTHESRQPIHSTLRKRTETKRAA